MNKGNFNPRPNMNRLIDQLRQSKLRVTESRLAILHVLLEKHGPFTIDEIYRHVTRGACDLATIYRSMASLENAGLIRRCEFGDGTARYELAAMESHHHHHVICKSCRRIEVLDDCELNEIDRFAQKRGFVEVTHSLEFFGICQKCQIKM